MKLVIKRSTNLLNVYGAKDATSPILTSGSETIVSTSNAPPKSYWVECTDTLTTANIEFFLRSAGGQDVKLKTLPFRSFTTVVCALSGEVFNTPTNAANQGTYDISEALYLEGYNIAYYPESSETRAAQELKDQRAKCGIAKIGVFGWSHGGGSTYNLALALGQVAFTGYIDAIAQGWTSAEDRYPTGSAYHFNYYQRNWFTYPPLAGDKTNPPGANKEKDLSSTTDHFSIVVDPSVQADIKASLKSQISP